MFFIPIQILYQICTSADYIQKGCNEINHKLSNFFDQYKLKKKKNIVKCWLTMLLNILTSSTSSYSILPYCLLFLVTFVEGPIATLVGGSLASTGFFQPLPVYFSVVLANLTADLCWYSLGRFCKVEWIKGIIKKMGINPCRIDDLAANIQRNAPKLLFLTKFSTGFPIPTLIATGLGKVPIHNWIGALIGGELIKSAILVGVGYSFSKTLQKTSGTVQITIWIITALLVVAGLFWRMWNKRRSSVR